MNTDTRSRSSLVLIGFLIVAGFFLVTEHRAHLFGILPFVLLLACPFLLLLHAWQSWVHRGREGDNRSNEPHASHRMPEERGL